MHNSIEAQANVWIAVITVVALSGCRTGHGFVVRRRERPTTAAAIVTTARGATSGGRRYHRVPHRDGAALSGRLSFTSGMCIISWQVTSFSSDRDMVRGQQPGVTL
jgi:hypothetical protein